QESGTAAHRALVQCGTDVTRLRTSAMQLAMGIAPPRRMTSPPAAVTQRTSGIMPIGRAVTPAPTPLPVPAPKRDVAPASTPIRTTPPSTKIPFPRSGTGTGTGTGTSDEVGAKMGSGAAKGKRHAKEPVKATKAR